MGLLTFLLVITIVIAVHELGHYLACKAFRVPVSEFAIGFGPKIFAFNAFGTEWSFRTFPLGGYVKPEGLEEESLGRQAIVAVAGPLANILPVLVIAAFAGIFWEALVLLGVMYIILCKTIIGLLMQPFVSLFTLGAGTISVANTPVVQSMAGPISMARGTGNALVEHSFIMVFLTMLLLINVSVALFNLLPIPILDGGRILFCGIEKIVGRAKSLVVQKYANIGGIIFLLGLMVFIMGKELIEWIF